MDTRSETPRNSTADYALRSYRATVVPYHRGQNLHAYEYEARIYMREGFKTERSIWRTISRLRRDAWALARDELRKLKREEHRRRESALPRAGHFGMLGYAHDEATKAKLRESAHALWESGKLDHTPLGLKRLCRLASPDGKLNRTEWDKGMDLRQAWLYASADRDEACKAALKAFIDSKRRSVESQRKKRGSTTP